MTLAQAIGKRILELTNNKYSLKILAELSDVPLSTLKNLIYNKTKHPDSTIIFKICQTLNISMSEFYNSTLFEKVKL